MISCLYLALSVNAVKSIYILHVHKIRKITAYNHEDISLSYIPYPLPIPPMSLNGANV